MPKYEVKCKECDYTDTWICSSDEYIKRIKEKCLKCNTESLYQYFGNWKEVPVHFKGYGWTQGPYSKKYRTGTKEAMEQAESENDYLHEVANKKGGIPENIVKQRKEAGLGDGK